MFICLECGTVLEPSAKIHQYSHFIVCQRCFNSFYIECVQCGKAERKSHAKEGYCLECQKKVFRSCFYCGEQIKKTEAFKYEGDYFCQECKEDKFTTCSDCGTIYKRWELKKFTIDKFCDVCYDKNVVGCDCCGRLISAKTQHTRTGKQLCSHCRECIRCGEVYLKQDFKEGLCQSCWFESH